MPDGCMNTNAFRSASNAHRSSLTGSSRSLPPPWLPMAMPGIPSSSSTRTASSATPGQPSGSGAPGPTPLTFGSSRTMPASTAETSASPRSARLRSSGSGMAWACTSIVVGLPGPNESTGFLAAMRLPGDGRLERAGVAGPGHRSDAVRHPREPCHGTDVVARYRRDHCGVPRGMTPPGLTGRKMPTPACGMHTPVTTCEVTGLRRINSAPRGRPVPSVPKETSMISGKTTLIAHLGYPTFAFKAPLIYNPWFDKNGIDAVVVPMGVNPEEFREFFPLLFKMTIIGRAVVTMPHKVTTTELVDELTPIAQVAGASNAVLLREDGSLIGDQFDGAGFARGVARKGFDVKGKRALVVGNGGVGS